MLLRTHLPALASLIGAAGACGGNTTSSPSATGGASLGTGGSSTGGSSTGGSADSAVVLRLGQWQGAWIGSGVGAAGTEAIDRPELRAAFCRRGALREPVP